MISVSDLSAVGRPWTVMPLEVYVTGQAGKLAEANF
jgi:hypothetical protein